MVAAARGSVFERHPRLTGSVLAVLAALATDVLFTHAYAYLRSRRPRGAPGVAAARPANRKPEAAPPFKVRSQVYHHGFQPLWNDTNEWGNKVYRFRTNSLGFIDRAPRSVSLEPAGRRVVLLGDSFTEGVGLPYEKTFAGLVDAALAKQGSEALNAATVSYAPIIYFRKTKYYLEQVGLRFQELAVFIDVSDIQDEVMYRFDARGRVVWDEARKAKEEEANRAWGGEPEPPGWFEELLEGHTTACVRAYHLLHDPLSRHTRAGTQTGRRRALWTAEPRFFAEYGSEGLKNAAEHMERLHVLLQERGIRLVVAVYPWPDQIVRAERPSKQSAFWRGWCESRGVGFIDYFPEFIDATPAREVLDRYFIPGDVHWNEAGHRLVAEVFLRFQSEQRP